METGGFGERAGREQEGDLLLHDSNGQHASFLLVGERVGGQREGDVSSPRGSLLGSRSVPDSFPGFGAVK